MSAEKHILELSKYIRLKEIGEGGFGKVYKVREQETNQLYAAKISKNFVTPESQEMIQLSREVNINAGVNHPTVLKFIGYSPVNYDKQPFPVIITEYAENGTLHDIIELERHSKATFENWTSTKKLMIIYGIASGMKYLHENNILHRDLKPANILMDSMLCPKISDFGLSKQIHENEDSKTPQSISGFKGTPLYMPPESFISQKQTKSGDVYAFGMIVYELLTLEIPFKKMDFLEIQIQLRKGHHPTFTTPIDDAYRDLIERCWSNDPEERPTFERIVEELENNRDFITNSIDEKDFFDYIEFIKNEPICFNNKQIIKLETFVRNPISKAYQKINIRRYIEEQQNQSPISSFLSRVFGQEKLYPANEFKKLSEECQGLVVEAENDPEKQFYIGTSLIEGKNNFPLDVSIGIKYLEKSVLGKNIDSTFYLSNLIYKGEVIEQDIQKSKKYLSKYFNTNDVRIDTLYSKIFMKEKNYKEAFICFEKHAKTGDLYSMYKYGKMLFYGYGCKKNTKDALYYINQKIMDSIKANYFYFL